MKLICFITGKMVSKLRRKKFLYQKEIEILHFLYVDFDVTSIESSSIRFGRTETNPVRAPIFRNLNGDGFLDAIYGFQMFDCNFQLGDTEGWLTGLTDDGTPLLSSDSVLVLL